MFQNDVKLIDIIKYNTNYSNLPQVTRFTS